MSKRRMTFKPDVTNAPYLQRDKHRGYYTTASLRCR